jgi:protein TonB
MISLALLLTLAADANAPSAPIPRQPYERLVSREDYPAAARAQGIRGTTRVELDVAATGRITACRVAVSSGAAILDAATCRLLSSRARFAPARDGAGQAVAGTVEASLSWSPDGR